VVVDCGSAIFFCSYQIGIPIKWVLDGENCIKIPRHDSIKLGENELLRATRNNKVNNNNG